MTNIEVAFGDPTYVNDFEGQELVFTELREELGREFPSYTTYVSEANLGHGADWPTILLGIYVVFSSGKSIKENLEAWKHLVSKFCFWLRTTSKARGIYRCNQGAAILIALEAFTGGDLDRLGLIDSVQVARVYGQAPVENPRCDLEISPEQVFVITVDAGNDSEVFFVKSTGEIIHKFKLPPLDYMNF